MFCEETHANARCCSDVRFVQDIQERKGDEMGPFDYVVVKLYGDYADLKRTDIESDELLMIARALLPDEVEEGTKLHYEMFEYTVIC